MTEETLQNSMSSAQSSTTTLVDPALMSTQYTYYPPTAHASGSSAAGPSWASSAVPGQTPSVREPHPQESGPSIDPSATPVNQVDEQLDPALFRSGSLLPSAPTEPITLPPFSQLPFHEANFNFHVEVPEREFTPSSIGGPSGSSSGFGRIFTEVRPPHGVDVRAGVGGGSGTATTRASGSGTVRRASERPYEHLGKRVVDDSDDNEELEDSDEDGDGKKFKRSRKLEERPNPGAPPRDRTPPPHAGASF